MTSRLSPSERLIHIAIVDYLNAVLPESHLVAHLYNNPRSAAAGAAAKRMGMLAGIPDLMIIRPLGRMMFIEVKKEGGRLSPEQTAFRLFCKQWGVPHAVCRSIEDVREYLDEWGVETKETRANLTTACKRCNSSKRHRTPEQWRGVR